VGTGLAGGYGWYHDGTIFSPNQTIKAGVNNRFTVGAVLGEDLYQRVRDINMGDQAARDRSAQ